MKTFMQRWEQPTYRYDGMKCPSDGTDDVTCFRILEEEV